MEGFVSIPDFVDHLKNQGLVIVPKEFANSNMINGLPFNEYQKQLSFKAALTPQQISTGKLWGDIETPRVYQLIKQHLSMTQVIRNAASKTIKVPMVFVRNIAVNRSQEWPNVYK